MLRYILLCMMFITVGAFAQTETEAGTGTESQKVQAKATAIAVLEYSKVQKESKAWKEFTKQFDKVKDQYQANIKKKQDELQKRQEELRKQQNILSKESFAAEEQKFREAVASLKNDTESLKKNLDDVFNKALGLFRRNIAAIASEVATEKGIDIVFNKNANNSTVFVWSDSLSITDEVLKRFDKQHPESVIKIE